MTLAPVETDVRCAGCQWPQVCAGDRTCWDQFRRAREDAQRTRYGGLPLPAPLPPELLPDLRKVRSEAEEVRSEPDVRMARCWRCDRMELVETGQRWCANCRVGA